MDFAYNTSAILTSVLFLILSAAVIYRILKVHMLTAIRTKMPGGQEIVSHIKHETTVIAAAPAAVVFYRGGTAVGRPVAVRAAADGLQLVQGERLVRLFLLRLA